MEEERERKGGYVQQLKGDSNPLPGAWGTKFKSAEEGIQAPSHLSWYMSSGVSVDDKVEMKTHRKSSLNNLGS